MKPTKFVNYAMGWVIAYKLPSVRGDPWFYVLDYLTYEERARLPHRYIHDLDDPYKLFPTPDAAQKAAQRLSKEFKRPGLEWLIRVMVYSTPDPKTADRYVILRRPDGSPMRLEDMQPPTQIQFTAP